MTPASDATQAIRALSRTIFGGAQYRVEIGVAIADGDGIVCIKDLADAFGGSPGTGSVNTELKLLEKAGLLTRMPKTSSDRKVYLQRQDSPYWDLCCDLEQRATRPAPR